MLAYLIVKSKLLMKHTTNQGLCGGVSGSNCYKTFNQSHANIQTTNLLFHKIRFADTSYVCFSGVAHLHGYTVNDKPYSSKKNAFDLTPPEPRMRTFHFHAETEIDKERLVLKSDTHTNLTMHQTRKML